MKYTSRISLLVLLLCSALASMPAQDAKSGEKSLSGFRSDLLSQFDQVQKQIMELEQAIPADKFSWRPALDVRSISEVYQHISFGSYVILKLAGYEPPAAVNFSMDIKKWDTATTDKAKIADNMKASFDHLRSTVEKMNEADLEKKLNFFGNEVSLRHALLSALSHFHEHLGQSIAYARMNGIVPPWTAKEMAKEKEKKDGK